MAASKLARGASVAGLQRVVDWVLAQPEFVPVPDASHGDAGWEQRWTSRRLLAIESDLSEHFAPAARGIGAIDEATVAAAMSSCALGADQAATVHKVTTNGLGVEVIVGRAGSGKTYTMDAVRAVYEHAGYRLVGVAPSARAARELADGAAIDAYTIPRFMRHAAPQLVAADVVIVDEAGMAGTVDLHTIITSARRACAKVILVGDHHQLPEVAAGGGFAAAVAAAGEHAGELTVNRRQHAEWERAALDELRHGRVNIAFAAYVDHGRVVLRGDVDEIHAAAVADWLTAHRGDEMAMLLAGTRAEARVINDAARAAVGDDLTGPVLEVRGRPFQAGDRIVLLRNDANQHDLDHHRRCRVDNGMIATITAVDIDGDTFDVELINGRRIRLGRDYVLDGHIDHGYATTIHKAQGVTCDRTFVVGPAGLYRQAGYVAMSRPRHGASIYATSRDATAMIERPHSRGIPLPDEHDDNPAWDLRTALETSRAKSFASSHQPHLTEAADLAAHTTLDVLGARARHIQQTIRRLTAAGYTDPHGPAQRLHTSRDHRRYLHPGGRVKALDWDNIGTVAAMFNDTGTALVDFVSSDGHRTRTKTLEWADLQPVDNPEPVDDLDAAGYFTLAQAAVDETVAEWNEQLAAHHIDTDEPGIVAAAIAQRRRKLAHRLAAD
ncbi:MAG: AAA family ATPase, partial [Actinomycetota bacterium]|nr:AAA family ATPase [Actinomycetota bacterium]